MLYQICNSLSNFRNCFQLSVFDIFDPKDLENLENEAMTALCGAVKIHT